VPKLPRDLETITLTCLRKDPAERYPSADVLADDLRRFLTGEPIAARPAGTMEVAWKWAKRHCGPVGTAALVFLTLIAGAGVAMWQAVRATDAERATAAQLKRTQDAEQAATRAAVDARAAEAKARDEEQKAKAAEAKAVERERKAKAARETAEAVAEFVRDVLAQGSAKGQAFPARAVNRNLTVKEAMDYTARGIGGRFPGRPDIEAAVRGVLGQTYLELAAFADARAQLETALALREKTLGPDHPDALTSVHDLAALYLATGDYPAARPLLQRTVAGFEKARGPDHAHILAVVLELGLLYKRMGDHAAALPLYRWAAAGFERSVGPEHPSTLTAVNNLALLHQAMGDHSAAQPLLERALAGREKTLGPDHPDTLLSVNNLAFLHQSAGDYPAALPLIRRALVGREKVLGPDHPDTLLSTSNLAFVSQAMGDVAAAETLYRRALAGREKVLGPDHPSTLLSTSNLARLYFNTRRFGDAVPLFRRALRGYESRPDRAADALLTRSYLGLALLGDGTPAEAEPHLLAGFDGLSQRKQLNRQDRTLLRVVIQELVELYEATNRPAEAAAWRAKLAALPLEAAPPRPSK
jgi:tetratricopeptide (TPR) repeat protein